MDTSKLVRVFPFLDWFQAYNVSRARMDLIGGVTVALVLVPQSMAYAQLAGLPAYYGLYAAFLPPTVAALFGSSRQLATGPVAIVSLMTATALEPLATTGSSEYIAYAIVMALLVGVFQLLLGLLRLGLVVNFLSHPVVIGFTNAAALIIATSQLSKFFGVTIDAGHHHYETVYNVVKAAMHYTHWPTLVLGLLAVAVMVMLKKTAPRVPNVLVAVALTTLISWATGFEKNAVTDISHVDDEATRQLIEEYCAASAQLENALEKRVHLRRRYGLAVEETGVRSMEAMELRQELELLDVEIEHLEHDNREHRTRLRSGLYAGLEDGDGRLRFIPKGPASKQAGGTGTWRMKVGVKGLDRDALVMMGGGAVVGVIPQGLPSIRIPRPNLSTVIGMFPMAMIISLLGFMEAISIAKAIAAKTGQRLDPNQELIGQGLANIVGAAGQSYAVSGSFSRSAVNLQAGAYSGLSSVFSSLVVVVVLLFLTPMLYHLPQSVLAAIIMMAVIGLLGVRQFVHAWRAHRHDGAVAVISFVCTLVFAPHLDRGILIGVVLSLLLYLLRNMKPVLASLSLHVDGTYRDRARYDLEQCPYVAVVRYAGSLFFANVSYLEDKVLETVRSMPHLRHLVIIGNGMNELDASGVDIIETLLERLHSQGLRVSFSGLNDGVVDTMRRTGLLARIGEENLYPNAERAVVAIWDAAHEGTDERDCPLRVPPVVRIPVSAEAKHADWPEWGEPRPDGTPRTITLAVADMREKTCASRVEEALREVAGVVRADTNHRTGQAIVSFHPDSAPETDALIDAVEKAGYRAVVE